MANMDITYGFIVKLMSTIAISKFDRKIRYFIYLLLTNFKFNVDLLKCNFSFAQNRLRNAAKVVTLKT
jgi:hypothetical protein